MDPIEELRLRRSSEKPELFDGKNFKRWQQKLRFYLTTLQLEEFIVFDKPDFSRELEPARSAMLDKWEKRDYMCRNYILNCLSSALYDVYFKCLSAKSLWSLLDKKYATEDAGSKKFVVGKFLEYKMDDSRKVVTQVEELQIIIHEMLAEGYQICEAWQVAAIIEKLPPNWKDYKNSLKHKRKEISLEDLIILLRIEEDNMNSELKESIQSIVGAKANLVEGKRVQKNSTNNNKKGGNFKSSSKPTEE